MRFAQEISIFNPFAIEKKVIEIGTAITQTAAAIELRASELYAEKGTVTDMQSRLTLMAGQISSEVTAREGADSQLSSRIDQTPHTIKLSVSNTAASKTSGPSITLTVKDANGNTLSTDSGTIKIDGNVVFTNQLSTAGSTTINGSNITTGSISANRISGGTLSLGGASNGNGQMRVYDANNVEIGRWNKDGIYIKNGEIYQEQYVNAGLKNAWLRIKSTEITGGYTGLGHTAKVDLAEYVDYVTGSTTRRVGVLKLLCQNGGVAITPDDVVVVNTPKEIALATNAEIYLNSARGSDFSTYNSSLQLTTTDAKMFASKDGQSRSHVYLGADSAELYRRNSSGKSTTGLFLNDNQIGLYTTKSDGLTLGSGFYLETSGERHALLYANELRVRRPDYDGNVTRIATTKYDTNFAPTGEGVRRICDIVNGLICNMREIYYN